MNQQLALQQSKGTSSEKIHQRLFSEVEGKRGPLLDLGCGTGEFLAALKGSGRSELTGCDAFKHSSDWPAGIGFFQADLNAKLPAADGSYSIVTAIEVIEHLENPRHLVREIHRLLAPGGTTLITTPNNECFTSLVSLALKGHFSAFADNCYPAHITPVLEIDLVRMMRECGFTGIRVAYTDHGRLPGMGLHWQSLLPGVFRGKRFSDNYIVIGTKSGTKSA